MDRAETCLYSVNHWLTVFRPWMRRHAYTGDLTRYLKDTMGFISSLAVCNTEVNMHFRFGLSVRLPRLIHDVLQSRNANSHLTSSRVLSWISSLLLLPLGILVKKKSKNNYQRKRKGIDDYDRVGSVFLVSKHLQLRTGWRPCQAIPMLDSPVLWWLHLDERWSGL